MATRANKWDARNKRNMAAVQRAIDELFKELSREAALIASVVSVDGEKPFSFDDYPMTKQRVDRLLSDMRNGVQTVVLDGIDLGWKLGNDKNDALVDEYFGVNVSQLSPEQRRAYYTNNAEAQAAFKTRRENGLNLSDRVWRYSDQFKSEIEMGIDIGLGDGLDADELSRRLQSYLREPNKLFRRVRDKYGNLQLSKAAKAYHPGRGVYRSSYKNARRLAATETNIAYRTSDYERYQQLDFVVGIRIELSNNHTLNGVPFYDICDKLSAPIGSNATKGKGCYQKDFKFTGWHPLCRCTTFSILKAPEEVFADNDRIMAGEPLDGNSVNRVDDVPQEFKNWLVENEDRMKRAKSLPYFMQDNTLQVKQYAPKVHDIMVRKALNAAKEASVDFQRKSEAIARQFGATITPVNLKSLESTRRKIDSGEKECIGSIYDLVRNTIIVRDNSEIHAIVEEIQRQFLIPYGKGGQRRIKPQNTQMGYTGIIVNVQLKGVCGEIQINIPQMIYAKDDSAKFLLPKDVFDEIRRKSGLECGLGHKYYEEWRLPGTSPERKRELEKLSREYYDAIRKVVLSI